MSCQQHRAGRDPNQVGYNAVYDALEKMTLRTDTFGITTSATYDLGGNVTVSVDGKGKSTTSQYDASGRKISVTDRLVGQTLYSMDLASNLISITDAEGQVTSYSYNDRGLRASETYPDHASGSVPGDPDCGQRFYQYNSAVRLLHVQDQANHWQTMIYDLASRLTERQYRIDAPTGTPIDSDTFAHDRVGRMTSAVSGRYSNTVSMDYDSIGRTNSESLAIGGQTYVTGYERDARNQINKIAYPSGRESEYSFTSRGELDTIDWDQSQIENRGYDNGGRMTSVDRPHADEARVYDLANRLTSIANTAGVGTLSYTWDANSNKLTETWTGVMAPWSFTTKKPAAPTFKEGYDDEDRFRRFIRSGQSQDIYLERTLIGNNTDLATNGTSSLRTFNAVHEMVSVGGNAQQFDNRGNVTSTHAGVGLSFDFDNRLKQATPVAGKVVDYQYDALGKRVGKKVTENSVVVEDTIYVHASPNCVAEYNRGASPTNPVQEYVYGDAIDSLAIIVRNNGTEKLAVTRNQQSSVVALVDNASGTVVERYTYDPFGKRTILAANGTTVLTTSAYSNPYGYTSREHDAESGLMYFRARYYDTTTGEFTSRDPLEYVDGMSLMRGYFVPGLADPTGSHLVNTGEVTSAGETIYRDLHTGKLFVDDPNGIPSARYPDRTLREVDDKDAFAHLRPNDDRGVTQRYCDSWREGNKVNKWTQCACQVSRTIDGLIAGLTANAILGGMEVDGMDREGAIARIKWFRCTRTCMVLRWQDADDAYFGRQANRNLTPEWQVFVDNCGGANAGTKDCCRLQVTAEQTGLSECMKICGKWKWGNPSGQLKMHGWDRNWDFNDLQQRITFANWRCCGDDHPDGKTPKCNLINW